MASPKTLEMRAWRQASDIWLKGFYIWTHQPGLKGIPYRRTFGVPKRRKNTPPLITPDLAGGWSAPK